MITLDNFPGMHISAVCRDAVERANAEKDSVRFEFNGTEVIANPGDSPETLVAKWNADFEAAAKAYRESPEYAERQRKEAEEWRRKTSAVLTEPATTYEELRDAKEPWPYTEKQLAEYVASLVDRQHDYNTAVYAMSLAAVAAFNYVAHKVGSSGFQASCADFDFIRRTRSITAPFMLVKAGDSRQEVIERLEKLNKAK